MKTTLLDSVTKFGERRYRAVWNEEGIMASEEFGLKIQIDTDANDYEWKYSLLDYANEVFNLKLHESIYFKGNRDDENSKGFIVRIK